MNIIGQSLDIAATIPIPEAEQHNWYALLTRARHEKLVAQRLREAGVTSFLPLVSELRKWSDRQKLVEFPLFSCYVFAKLPPSNEGRLKALRIDGVHSLVGRSGQGTQIPEEQIESVRRLAEARLAWQPHPFLKIGQRVRIRSGALNGVEGVLAARSGGSTLVVSIDAIQRSLAVRIDGYAVEPI